MFPSTLVGILAAESAELPPEVSDTLQIMLAVPPGLFAGTILGLLQWGVLRRHVSSAGWWVPANALAWALSTPVMFSGTYRAILLRKDS